MGGIDSAVINAARRQGWLGAGPGGEDEPIPTNTALFRSAPPGWVSGGFEVRDVEPVDD
jgi:hypothetical protein